jgi:predicted RNase H-like nuclease (RuvC/YqgF family)
MVLMAELSFDDVRRAAQTAATSLQTALNDIRTNIQNTRGDINRLNPNNDFQYRFNNLERAINDLTQYTQRLMLTLQQAQNVMPSIQQTQQLVLRVEQRLVNTEHMVSELSRYMEVLHAQMVHLNEASAQVFGRAEP